MSDNPDDHKPMRPVIWARLMLLVPFVAMLWVSSYNFVEPTIGGVPSFIGTSSRGSPSAPS